MNANERKMLLDFVQSIGHITRERKDLTPAKKRERVLYLCDEIEAFLMQMDVVQ